MIVSMVTSARAESDGGRSFVLTDLSARSRCGVESSYGRVHQVGADEGSETVFGFDLIAHLRLAEHSRIVARYGFGIVSEFDDWVVPSGNATLGVIQLFPTMVSGSPIMVAGSVVVSFPIATGHGGADQTMSGLHAVHDLGFYSEQIATARFAIDVSHQRGRYFAQAQLGLHAQFYGGRGSDPPLVRVGAMGGMHLRRALAAVVELTAFAPLRADQLTCNRGCPGPWEDGPIYAPAVNLGLRYDHARFSTGVHAFMPLYPAMIERVGFGIGADVGVYID